MVKKRKKNIRKSRISKLYNEAYGGARKINASTAYGTCGEQLSPFGGLLGLVKLLDLFDFKKHFDESGFPINRKIQKARHSRSCLKRIGTPIGYFAQTLTEKLMKLSTYTISGQMWKT